jgi:hypothetical protein
MDDMAEPSPGGLSEAEITRRAPVWHVLSDFFLDTKLDAAAHRHIARVIAEAGYSAAEAEAILRDEVLPVFLPNLLSVAGEWAGWPKEEVRRLVLRRVRRRRAPRLFAWLGRWIRGRRMARIRADWTAVRRYLEAPPS